MKHLGKFTRYQPDLPEDHPMYSWKNRILWSKAEDGTDWYDIVKEYEFIDKYTYLVVDGEDNIIHASNDITELFPNEAMSVVAITKLDPSIDLEKDVVFASKRLLKSGKIVDRPIPKPKAGMTNPLEDMVKRIVSEQLDARGNKERST